MVLYPKNSNHLMGMAVSENRISAGTENGAGVIVHETRDKRFETGEVTLKICWLSFLDSGQD